MDGASCFKLLPQDTLYHIYYIHITIGLELIPLQICMYEKYPKKSRSRSLTPKLIFTPKI